ncbi:hypothetical protein GMORB2_0510 [Geosmithia morbida]|uniref:Uncharacterized protein n=1 Tax=Geosmithia morbida TaxID=1094350 RepID=A0A9P4Z144_9HYPO|nr:uncharacterized protein GMORB2_0510 [Geosmithia morbida]KAF4126773.1 hypothetical protein GMORB2_0510 [Geosmithia morbida]
MRGTMAGAKAGHRDAETNVGGSKGMELLLPGLGNNHVVLAGGVGGNVTFGHVFLELPNDGITRMAIGEAENWGG